MKETPWNSEPRRSGPSEAARLIVWESDGKWARHLRRLLTDEGVRVHEARTSHFCREMIAESPASIVVVQWTPLRAAVLSAFAARIRREFPAVRILAVADRAFEPFRWQILQTGMTWLCTSPRRLGPAVGIVRRHLASAPRPPRTPKQRIWDELPWRAQARSTRTACDDLHG